MQPLQILLNPAAGQGRARARFGAVEDGLWSDGVPFDLHEVPPERFPEMVRGCLDEGLPDLVAAGGDGTANALLNAVMELPREERARVTLGAIALGSSNDLHKPTDPAAWYRRTAVMLRPEDALPRAVFRLRHDGGAVHYLMNSSAGLLARGCHWFNRAPLPLRWLQRLHYGAAVQLLSLVNVLTYRGAEATVRLPDREIRGTFDGITLVKTPHVAAGLVFRTARSLDDGLFDVVCLRKVPVGELAGILEAYATEGPRECAHTAVAAAPEVTVEFAAPTRVEYDGETLVTRTARYDIRPGAVRWMGKGIPL